MGFESFHVSRRSQSKWRCFTVDGGRSLEEKIAREIIAIRDLVLQRVDASDISGLVLGGGYGRGEGGVYVVRDEEHVYNDYDFFVIVPYRSRARRLRLKAALAEVKAIIEPKCGIHVDFSPPMPFSSLARLPYEVMFMELKEGHHVVIGPSDLLSCMPDYDVAHPPLEECARLFLNRGMGLLLARQKLDSGDTLSADDHEFVVRNIRKAQIAMGDSLLFLNGCYSASYVERCRLFTTLDLTITPDANLLSRYYAEAIEFKLRPQHSVPVEHTLQSWLNDVTKFYGRMFLWFEQQRLEDADINWRSYSKRYRRLPYRGLIESVINVVRNLRPPTSRSVSLRECTLHPRDRILARLPHLLFEDGSDKDSMADIIQLWKYCG